MPRRGPRSTSTTTSRTSTPWPTRSPRPVPCSRSDATPDRPPSLGGDRVPNDEEPMPGLEDLYREIILDHYRSPRNRGELPAPPAQRVEGFNPLCGDEVVVYVQVQDGTVTDIRFAGQGCSISQSSASLMSAAVKGKTVEETRGLIRTFKAMMSVHEARLG